MDLTYNLVDRNAKEIVVPIGQPFPNCRCIIFDEYFQSVSINEEGKLYVGGVDLFVCDDLTTKVLIKINDEIFYRTGDFVRMDNKGVLHYIARKDQRIKLDGECIELDQIEECLLGYSSISDCLVIKSNPNHLVAYVQSSDTDEEQLRQYCQSHLSSDLIPSIFIILEQFPINPNGKIDRQLLPPPHFSALTNVDLSDRRPLTTLEEQLRLIFSKVFDNQSFDIDMTFGELGGSSLDALRTIHLIRQQIGIDINASLFFANPSIRRLAQAIQSLLRSDNHLSATSQNSTSIETLSMTI
jgi:acyl carrier protein